MLNVLEGVVGESTAGLFSGAHEESEAVEVLGLDGHVLLGVMGESSGEQVIGIHSVLDLSLEVKMSLLTTVLGNLVEVVVELDVTGVDEVGSLLRGSGNLFNLISDMISDFLNLVAE